MKVHALVRNPDSAKAKEVAARGAVLVKGDLLDKASLVAAFTGVDAVFIVTALEPFNAAGVANEIVQGQTAVAAAKEAKVPFVVLASVANSHMKTKIPHFDSKVIFEDDLKASGLAYCILKPACFMDNFEEESMEFKQGSIQFIVDPDGVPLPLVACEDIGEFAALAMHKPHDFKGKEIELAGDCLTGNQMAATVSKIRGGEPWTYSQAPLWLLYMIMHELAVMGYYFCSPGMKVDIAECTKVRPLLTFEAWLLKKGFDKKVLKPASSCSIM